MKTKEEILEEIDNQKRLWQGIFQQSQPDRDSLSEIEGAINILYWVLEREDEAPLAELCQHDKDSCPFYQVIERAKNSPPMTDEQIRQRLIDALEAPNPFFKYLKEKE